MKLEVGVIRSWIPPFRQCQFYFLKAEGLQSYFNQTPSDITDTRGQADWLQCYSGTSGSNWCGGRQRVCGSDEPISVSFLLLVFSQGKACSYISYPSLTLCLTSCSFKSPLPSLLRTPGRAGSSHWLHPPASSLYHSFYNIFSLCPFIEVLVKVIHGHYRIRSSGLFCCCRLLSWFLNISCQSEAFLWKHSILLTVNMAVYSLLILICLWGQMLEWLE